jgi:hypothetical protein
MRRELLATTATLEALWRMAAATGERAPAAETARPAALTRMDMP